MMRNFLLMIVALLITSASFGQLTGTKSIPGDYATLELAITDLNTQGVGAGGVIFDIAAGHTETFSTPIAGTITATGTLADPIVFQKSGVGANPLITAGIGTTTNTDGIIKIAGGDYITFDMIDLTESAANITATTQMEWGYALVKGSATAPFNGCQNVTIKNCAITLNKANTASVGIYSGNHIATATTSLTITAATDAMNNGKFFSNTISNVYIGIQLKGYLASSPYTLYDANNEVGVGGANTITNYGGAASTAYGIYGIYQMGIVVSNNSITSGTGTTTTLYGIFLSTGASSTITYNTVTLTGGATTSVMSGISNAMGYATYTVNISNNTVQNCTYATATTADFNGIVNSGLPTTTNINNNAVTGNVVSGTGAFYGIYNSASNSTNTVNMFSNQVSGNQRNGTGGSMYCMRASTATIVNYSNNIYNNTIAAGTGALYGIYDGASPVSENYYSNTIHDLTQSGTGSVYGIQISTAAGLKNTYSNTIYNLTAAGGTVYGIGSGYGAPHNIYKNNIYNLSGNATGSLVYGIYISAGTTMNVYNNFVSDLKTPAATGANALNGIYFSGGTNVGAYYNTVYLNATSSGATFGSSGIYKSSTSTGDFRNNVIMNLSTPGTTSGNTVAYRWSGAYNATYYSANSNANNFYAGTPAANRLVFFDGTNSDQTIAAYQTRVSPKDAGAFSEDSPLLNKATAPYDLHMSTSVPTLCESGGVVVSTPAITDDIDGNPRSASNPDVGADEFAGIPASLINPGAFTASAYNSVQINLSYLLNPAGNPVVIVWNLTGTFTAPSGAPPALGDPFAGGTLLSNGTTSPINHTGLTSGTPYYYKAFSYDGSIYSSGVTATATPSVAPPTAFTATAASTTQIDLAWMLNASGHNVVIATSLSSTFGNPVNGTALNVSDPITGGGTVIYTGPLAAFNHTGLLAATNYYYKAWSVDTYVYYSTGVTTSAATSCPTSYAMPFIQNFEGTFFPPNCWTKANGLLAAPTTLTGTTSNWIQDDYRNVSSPVDKAARINIYSTGLYAWLFTPAIDRGTGSPAAQVEFDLSLNAYAASTPPGLTGTDDRFAVVISTDGGLTWTSANTLRLWDNAGSPYVYNNINYLGEHVVLSLAGFSGVVKIGFYGESTVSNADNDLMVNNLYVQLPPSCAAPTALTNPGLTESSATIGWSGAATVEIDYGSAGHVAGTGTVIPAISTNPYTITGLASNTIYDVYVRQDCGSENFSTWTGPIQFKTACDGVNSFSENFDAVTTPALPNCWTKIGSAGSAYTQTTTPNSTPNCVYMYSGVTVAPFAVLAMPPVKNAGAGVNQLRFNARGAYATGGILEVGYLTNYADPSTFTLLQSFTISALTYTEYICYPGTAPGTANILAFRHNGSTSVLIDDVAWEPLPTCPKPTALTATHVALNSATLGWTEAGTATAWEYAYGVSPFPVPAGAGTAATSNTVPISGLTENTTYQFYVRANCGTEFSNWSGPVSFYTGYCIPAPINVDGTGITNVVFSTVSNPTGAEPGNYGNYSAMVGDVQLTATIPVAITYSTGYTYDTKIWIDWNDNLDFTDPDEEVYVGMSTNSNPTTLAASFVVPVSAPLGQHRMRIGGVDSGPPTPCYTGSWGSFEDYTVNVIPAPACPSPTALIATAITMNTANLTWTPSGSETAWEYVYGVSPQPTPTGAGTASSSSTVNPISGLTAATSYQFYVRANCGTDFSSWAGPYTFTTACGSLTIPYTQNFDGVTAPAIPNCMTVTDDNADAVQWVNSTSAPRSTPNSMRISYNSAAAMNDWFFTPPLTLGVGTYSVSFWYRSSGSSFPEKLEVKWGSAANAASMTNGPIFDNNNVINTVYAEGTGSIVVTVAGDYYVGWHGYSDADMFYLLVDDISITQPLAHDISAISVDLPSIVAAGTDRPRATFKNEGTSTETSFPVNMTIGAYTSTQTVASLAPGASIQVSFDPWTAAVGAYSATACAQLVGDLNTANDCQTKAGTVEAITKFYAYNTFTDYTGYFYKEHPEIYVPLAAATSPQFIGAGTWANGVWYGSEYYDAAAIPPSGGGWWTIDPGTGAMTKLADLAMAYTGITYDHTANIMYGITWDGTTNSLWTITPATGAAVLLGTIAPGELLINLATDGSGFLYSLGITTDHLFKINPAGLVLTDVGTTGILMSYAQDMEYDYATNTMYAAAYTTAGSLYTVDLTTGTCTLVGAFAGGAEMTGLAIPYSASTPITLTGVPTGSACASDCNGSVDITVAGGTGSYTYVWSNLATTQDISSLCAGIYSVTVTSGAENTTGSWTVTAPAALGLSASTVPAACPTSNDGSIDLTVSGGVAPYTYIWTTSATTEDISGLAPGDYTVTVTDGNACVISGTYSVGQTSAVCPNITVTGTVSTVVCYNATNTITVAGTPTTFIVSAPTGNATFIAGVKILFEPGTHVEYGAYMHGYISTTYCSGSKSLEGPVAEIKPEETQMNLSHAYFNLYPNPTSGNFTLEQKGDKTYGMVKVEIYSMNGKKVMTENIVGEKKHEFNFSDLPVGLYFVKIVADEYVETIKLIKSR
jgi:hypothetical protein